MTYKIFYIPFTKTERAVSDTKGRKVIEATEITSVVVPTGDVTEAEDWDSDIILRLTPWLVAIMSLRRLWRLHILWKLNKKYVNKIYKQIAEKCKQIAEKCKQTFVMLVRLIIEHMQQGQLLASNRFVYLGSRPTGLRGATWQDPLMASKEHCDRWNCKQTKLEIM